MRATPALLALGLGLMLAGCGHEDPGPNSDQVINQLQKNAQLPAEPLPPEAKALLEKAKGGGGPAVNKTTR